MLHKYCQKYNVIRRLQLKDIRVKMAASQSPSNGSSAVGAGNFCFKGSADNYACLKGQKRESPAAERNKQPILDVLLEYLPRGPAGRAATSPTADDVPSSHRQLLILEIASGSGQHSAHVAAALPDYDIQPSDVSSELFGSIAAYASGLPNVRLPPLLLDAAAGDHWPRAAAAAAVASSTAQSSGTVATSEGFAEAILCINMCHISPLAATRGLMQGAGTVLHPGGGLLFVYGPFTTGGQHTSESNAAFDTSLRSRNPEWGYRDLDDLAAWAVEAGMERLEVRNMPANNFMLVFQRRPSSVSPI